MRSSWVVGASNSQCRSRNCPGFDPSMLRHSGIWGVADEVVSYIKRKNPKNPPLKNIHVPRVALPKIRENSCYVSSGARHLQVSDQGWHVCVSCLVSLGRVRATQSWGYGRVTFMFPSCFTNWWRLRTLVKSLHNTVGYIFSRIREWYGLPQASRCEGKEPAIWPSAPYLPANERHIAYTSRQPMRMQRAVPSERSVSIFVTGLFTEARWLNSRIKSI